MKKYNMNIFNISNNRYLNNAIRCCGVIAIAMLFVFCSEEKNEPLESSSVAPGLVTDIKSVSLPGGAEVSYKIPSDKDLSYVEAVVHTPEGKVFNYKSSSYSTSFIVEGLATTQPQEVTIWSVSKSEVKSEPQTITINPLEPPYKTVFESIKLQETFGGVRLKFKNEFKSDLAYFLGYIDDKGVFIDYDGYYSKSTSIADTVHNFRGFDPEPKKFAMYIRDRWDNYSDTLYAELTPLLEVEIEKSRFRRLALDNDGPFYTTSTLVPENLWDGFWGTGFDGNAWYMEGEPGEYRNFAFDGGAIVDPMFLTIDIGAEYFINRIKVNHYWRFYHTAARKWEVWGSKDLPPADGNWEWEGWRKLADMEQIRPSKDSGGEPYTDEDKQVWLQGTSADVDQESAIRYIRIKSKESWNGQTNFSAAEITFYGQSAD